MENFKNKKVIIVLMILTLISILCFIFRSLNSQTQKHNVFIRIQDMNVSRESGINVLLKDGKVLILSNLESSEVFDSKNDKFKLVEKMNKAHGGFTATLLQDGRVLIVGGDKDTSMISSNAEIFDPKKGKFICISKLNYPRGYHSATLLKDGRVLIVGGTAINFKKKSPPFAWDIMKSEIFNPKTNKFEMGPKIKSPRKEHQAILLKDGTVLIIGGKPHQAELYDPKLNKFVTLKNMNYPAYFLQTVVLRNGKVLILTGDENGEHLEAFDPVKKTFSTFLYEIPKKSPSSTMTLLNNGNILFAGGYKKERWYVVETNESLILNPITKQFIKGPNMNVKRGGHSATLLNNGNVLITGGYNTTFFRGSNILKSAELYIP